VKIFARLFAEETGRLGASFNLKIKFIAVERQVANFCGNPISRS
jgi:hypothetical protein